MIALSIGDQARAFAMRSSISTIKNKLNVLYKEQGTHTVADLAQRLHGDLRVISNIDASMKLHERYTENTGIIQKRLAVQQNILNSIQEDSLDFAATVKSLNSVMVNNNIAIYSEKAKAEFEKAVAGLNSGFGGQSLFSGAMTENSPLLSVEKIMSGIHAVGDGENNVDDLISVVEGWFDAGNHLTPEFKNVFNNASINEREKLHRSIPISENKNIKLTVTAGDPEIMNTLKGLAIAAMAAEGFFADDYATKRALLDKGAEIISDNNIGMIGVSARIGEKESVVRGVEAENHSLVKMLDLANHDIRVADPAETTTAITHTVTHLDSLYKVTAAISRLSLAEYLR